MAITPYGTNNSNPQSLIAIPSSSAETAAQAALQIAIPIASNTLQNYIDRKLTIRIGEDSPQENKPSKMGAGPMQPLHTSDVKGWDFYNLGKSIAEGVLDAIGQSDLLETLSSTISKIWAQKGLPCFLSYHVVKHLTPLTCNWIGKSWHLNKTKSELTINKRPNALFKKFNISFYQEPTKEQPIHTPALARIIDRIVTCVKTGASSRLHLPNILIYGPPGTGKTLTANSIIKETQANYISLSGTQLTQWIATKEHICKIDELFNGLAAESQTTILLIDRADEVFKERNLSDQLHVELLDAFLHRTGTPSKKIMVIIIASQFDKIDASLLSRMSHTIKLSLPQTEERRRIIRQGVDRLFTATGKLFSSDMIQSIAIKTEGLCGRGLLYLMDQLYLAQMENCQKQSLTQDEITSIVEEVIDSKRASALNV
jgi:broad-specificity NMP kinase